MNMENSPKRKQKMSIGVSTLIQEIIEKNILDFMLKGCIEEEKNSKRTATLDLTAIGIRESSSPQF